MGTLTSQLKFTYIKEVGNTFFDLFPHRFDYIYAPHPEPHTAPNWQTESRHPLTDRMLDQGRFLYGVRFGAKTQYCLLDIDAGSPYHPSADPFASQRILAALESIGLVRYLAITSSHSGGLHLYFPLQSLQNSWELGAAITVLLSNTGFVVKPGCLEIFPNRKTYNIQGKPSLFNAHRLPLQMGSYLLNQDFQPIWGDRHTFIEQWRICQSQNFIETAKLHQILKQNRQQQRQISGKAAKFLNDLNTEIEAGWTGSGQTNYLLGRITMRAYIFHHILEGTVPLVGPDLINEIVATARSLPGYQEWCKHQHEIEDRAAEWARCVESSRYFHYGITKLDKTDRSISTSSSQFKALTWNQQQSQNTRDRIKQAIADLLNQNKFPAQTTARFKALTAYGIGGGSLYRHKDLWHSEFLNLDSEKIFLNSEDPDSESLNLNQTDRSILEKNFNFKEESNLQNKSLNQTDRSISEKNFNLENQSTFQSKFLDHGSSHLLKSSQYSTSLLPAVDGNSFIGADPDRSIDSIFAQTGGNSLLVQGFTILQELTTSVAIDRECVLCLDQFETRLTDQSVDRSTDCLNGIALLSLDVFAVNGDRWQVGQPFKPP